LKSSNLEQKFAQPIPDLVFVANVVTIYSAKLLH
jgi:hypothetical protein